MERNWDIAIVGGGGAGLTAAVYASRAGRSVALFERALPGGQIAIAGPVENFPGFPDGIPGADLADAMRRQAERSGARLIAEEVSLLAVSEGGGFLLTTAEGTYGARAVIVTAGAEHKRLGVPGEEQFTGRGVSYCATCDGPFFRDLEVAVVGGGDAAIDEGLLLTRHARRVHVIHRRDTLRAGQVLQDRAFANDRMDFTWNTVVERIDGRDGVELLALRHVQTGEPSTMAVSGVFVFIGHAPNSGLLRGLTPLDPGGHAIVDLQMRTTVPGLFVAGDVRTLAARQLVSACGDGATAAISADRRLVTGE